MVDIKLLKQERDTATFLVKGTTPAYMNTLRRLVLLRVPSMAVDEVTFVENGSALYDETVAHRMGLVPLVTDLDSYFIKSQCKCNGNGCARCELQFTLDKKGPCTVYAEDLKFADPKIKPAYPKMPITKLLEGQNLKLEGKASLGCGKQHMKFAPGTIHYRGYPKIKMNKAGEVAAEQCPVSVFKREGKTVKVANEEACILCNACVEVSPEGAIDVKASEEDFILTVESWGQLQIKEIVHKALEILNEELEALKESIKSIK